MAFAAAAGGDERRSKSARAARVDRAKSPGVVRSENPVAEASGAAAAVVGEVELLNGEIATIRRGSGQLGTSSDTTAFRERFRADIAAARDRQKRIARMVKALPSSRELSAQRAIAAFQGVVGRFEEVVREAEIRQRAIAARITESLKSGSAIMAASDAAGSNSDEEGGRRGGGGRGGRGGARQQQEQVESLAGVELQGFSRVDADLLREREEDALLLAQDVADLHQTFVDIAVLVNDQSKALEQVQVQVEETHEHVKAGNKQLVEATKLQSKGRKMLCFILLFVIIVAALVCGVMSAVGKLKW